MDERYGCQFGQKNREMIQDLRVRSEQHAVLCKTHDLRLQALEEEMRKLDERIDQLAARLSWILGGAAAVGAIFGTFISAVLSHMLR